MTLKSKLNQINPKDVFEIKWQTGNCKERSSNAVWIDNKLVLVEKINDV